MKFVRVSANICYEELSNRKDEFDREFESFSGVDSNPIDEFILKTKAKEGYDTDPLLLALLADLHKKIDDLTRYVKNEQKTLLELSQSCALDFAWYDVIRLEGLKVGETYYARMKAPLFRPRDIPFFFEAIDEETGKIISMWPADKADFDGYLASKEREEIARERGA